MSAAAPFDRLVMVGAGNMGGAMLRRWIADGVCPADAVAVVDRASPLVPPETIVAPSIAALDGRWQGAAVVLAVKPQQLDDVAANVAALRPGVLISILAGVPHARLRERCAADATVRAMPNMPVAIGRGVVALNGDLSGPTYAAVAALMAPLGLVEWIDDEGLFDAVTALSGCGPAFTYRFIDAMAKAAAALGLPADQAARLAAATVEGSAGALKQSGERATVLADRVASPGGSTREGLNVLDRNAALDRLMAETLAAACARNRALGG